MLCPRELKFVLSNFRFKTQLIQGNAFMLRKSTLLCFLALAIALLVAGCSGPDAPAKKPGSGKSLTTAP